MRHPHPLSPAKAIQDAIQDAIRVNDGKQLDSVIEHYQLISLFFLLYLTGKDTNCKAN